MWHGTRDGQTPQPVRMTLGNEGAFHPHSPALSVVVSRWLSLLCFGVSTGCRRKSYQHWISAVFHSSFFLLLFWLVIAELHGPLGVSQAGWVSSSMLASKHRKAFGCKMTKYVLLATVCLLTPTEHPGCSYVTQFICRVGWGQESSASSIRSPLFWVASKLLPGARWSPGSTLTLCLDYSLTLIDSSLPSEAEPELRTYISRRLSKGALLGGMGNIATVELRWWCFKSDISIDTSRNVDYNKIGCTGNLDPEMQEWAGWLKQNCSSQYPRASGWLLLLSCGAGKVSWSAWCWWKWIRHLLHGRIWKGTEPISFALKLLFIYFLSIQNVKTRIFVLFFPHHFVFVQRNRFFLDPPYV